MRLASWSQSQATLAIKTVSNWNNNSYAWPCSWIFSRCLFVLRHALTHPQWEPNNAGEIRVPDGSCKRCEWICIVFVNTSPQVRSCFELIECSELAPEITATKTPALPAPLGWNVNAKCGSRACEKNALLIVSQPERVFFFFCRKSATMPQQVLFLFNRPETRSAPGVLWLTKN